MELRLQEHKKQLESLERNVSIKDRHIDGLMCILGYGDATGGSNSVISTLVESENAPTTMSMELVELVPTPLTDPPATIETLPALLPTFHGTKFVSWIFLCFECYGRRTESNHV